MTPTPRAKQSFAAIVARLRKVTRLELRDATVTDLLMDTTEELGELAVGVSVEQGRKRKKLKEPALIEAVDLALCAFSMYFACGGKSLELLQIMDAKLAKWERNAKKPALKVAIPKRAARKLTPKKRRPS